MGKTSRPAGVLLLGVGTILSSMTISGFLLGYVTDYFLDTMPLFLLGFGFLGLLGGTLKVYKLLTHPDFNKS
ncbi:MAG: AtpZ/AtpI family protein [Gammaproteobacteria bacterium]|nr:AtpZ/AtpI family protein [Gammaproteobacteria bacterium]MDH5692066.1 AtpZ/AtpI family protein [Gammaproteobacteria bacterium]